MWAGFGDESTPLSKTPKTSYMPPMGFRELKTLDLGAAGLRILKYTYILTHVLPTTFWCTVMPENFCNFSFE